MRRLPLLGFNESELSRASGKSKKSSAGSLALPCPAVDLIQIACTLGRDAKETEHLLRRNPSLLLFAVAARFSDGQPPATTLHELVEWCDIHWLRWFEDQPSGWSESDSCGIFAEPARSKPAFAELKGFFADWKTARTNKSIRKRLGAWLQLTLGWNKRESKSCVRQVVGKQFSFPKKSAQRSQSPRKLSKAWLEDDQSGGDSQMVEALFQFRLEHQRLETQFEDRLLAQKLAAMKQLAYGASHEINNPLANISTRAQTLLADETNPERRHKLAMIYEQALRAHEMISDLMLFANPPAIDLEWIDVRLWIAKIINEVSPMLNQNSVGCVALQPAPIKMIVRVAADVHRMEVDAGHLAVALRLLIRNSVEAIGSQVNDSSVKDLPLFETKAEAQIASGTIELRVFTDPLDGMSFEVTDDGVGVSESARAHLFDPFYSSREAGRGLGFGLSKAWRIAELHGGVLTFDPEHSPGARFVLRVPFQQR